MLTKVALAIFLGFTSGALLRSLLYVSPYSLAFIGCVSLLLLAGYGVTRRSGLVLCSILTLGVLLGAIRVEGVLPKIPETYRGNIGSEQVIAGRIVEFPDTRESSQRLVIEDENGVRVLAVAPLHPKGVFGSSVTATGILARPESFDTSNGRTFRYENFLAKDRIYLVLEESKIEITSVERQGIHKFTGIAFDARNAFMIGIENAFVEPEASLASGMLLGGKQGLGEELLDMFIVTGLIHIVVLSGYNITIIVEAITRATSVLGRRWSSVLAGVSILAFVFAAGAGAASVRAGIMACISVFARITGRTYDALRALLLAIFMMLVFSPLSLVYDPGFQLSVAATLGLILLSKKIEPFFTWIKNDSLREVVLSTVAAQISVLPLLLHMTGILSWTSLPANILVLPFVPLAMFLSFIAGGVGILFTELAPIVAYPAHLLLLYIVSIAEQFSSLPYASVSIPSHSSLVTVAGYVLLVAVFYWREMTRSLHKLLK